MAEQIETKPVSTTEGEVDKPLDLNKGNDTQAQTLKLEPEHDKEVDVDDFNEILNVVPAAKIGQDKKNRETKPVEEKKEIETKVVEKVEEKKEPDKKPEEKKESLEKKPEEKKETDTRDYSDIPENILPVFKKLHNEAFNTFKPLVKALADKHAELESTKSKLSDAEKGIVRIPDNYYSHPDAYLLTPDFKKVAIRQTKAQSILNHWEQQYESVRTGKVDTYKEIQMDPKTGELYEGRELKVDANSDKVLFSYVKGAQAQLAEQQMEIRNLAKGHTQTYENAVREIKEFETEAFKTFNVEGEQKKSVDNFVKDTMSKTLPPQFHSDPLATGYIKALIVIQNLGDQLKKYISGEVKSGDKAKESEKKVDEDQRRAGPTASHVNDGGAKGGNDEEEVTVDSFKERMR